MRKLVRHVTRRSRVRRHHVLLATIALGLVVHEATAVMRMFSESKEACARNTEWKMLQEFELWSLHECPDRIAQFGIGDGIDPWGNPYRIVCAQDRERVTLAIVSLGPDDGQAHDDLTTVQSFSP